MNNSGDVRVSVCVVTYGHEAFIRQCLESILSQETDFAFEVIVGEDCSPDETAPIIRELQARFPEKLTAIFREQNLGGHLNFIDVFERAKGKYIAYCEGDDYWCDRTKLQRQFDVLELNSQVDLCFHPAQLEFQDQKKGLRNFYGDTPRIFSIEEVIKGRAGFAPSPSLFFRKSSLLPFPEWFKGDLPAGDLFLQVLGGVKGGAYYLPRSMSVYRKFTTSSQSLANSKNKRSSQQIKRRVVGFHQAFVGLKEQMPLHLHGLINKELALCLYECGISALYSGNRKAFCETRSKVSLDDLVLWRKLVFNLAIWPGLFSIVRFLLLAKRRLN